MDPKTASFEMMEKAWSDWFTMASNMQAQAAKSMSAATGREAADVENGGTVAAGGMPFLTADSARQFQQAFLETMSKYCEQYMRSPQFLEMTKQSLDNALTFRQQVNEFLNNAMAAGIHPPVAIPPDQAVIVDAVRETERKLRDHIEQLSDRIAKIEERLPSAQAKKQASKKSSDD